MLHKGKPRIFDASVRASSHSRTPSTFTIGKNPHLTKDKLHSKSTYFYRWSSRNSENQPLARFSCLSYIVPSVCTLTLLIGGIITINPILDSHIAYATSIKDTGHAENEPNISLTITPNTSDSTNGNVTVGEPAYFSNTITVGGSSISQYSLTLNTTSGSNGELVGQDNPYVTVGRVGSDTSTTNFPDNTWGYAISTVNTTPDKTTLAYNPVPGTENNNSAFLDFQKNLSGTVNNTYKLVFAAKLGTGMPADHYTTDVYLSAVASATETVENWFRNTARITTMQEMNNTICNNAPEHATSQLTDSRDGKLYWVTKLKDGNCWMTQNLDYDGGGSLISLPSMWITSGTSTRVYSTTQAYYDPGDYYYNGPTDDSGIPTHAPNKCSNPVNLGVCAQFSVMGTDKHYHVGNYYSWNAAVNGTGNIDGKGIITGEASGSICPNSWKLPTSNNTNNGSFAYLLTKYGLQSAITNSSYTIYDDPLYFVYSGNLPGAQLDDVGSYGRYWSSTPYSNDNFAFYLNFGTTVDPSRQSYRYLGNSIRCLFIPE